ncbi:hypothetical protein O3W44_22510 [Pantoea sp. LMR881]|uniref:hypothetical protein n=1 Tax=Pantoea sp. LMR881 TaxID=3014336 RepID=UPI0022AE8FEC|nr:hypothetical protein [Pantoea sp. LMR881]MCZ4061196.1 hypothetical protein [Pantoea sp. LMR881]MCZ4061307.1 hypothetical protein [Pantoea sp. LMR881]
MSQLADFRKKLKDLASHITPQASALLVKSARDNRLSPELQAWVSTVTPANIDVLLSLVDEREAAYAELDRQLEDFKKMFSDETETGLTETPEVAPESTAEDIKTNTAEATEPKKQKATSKRTCAPAGNKSCLAAIRAAESITDRKKRRRNEPRRYCFDHAAA